ncbi:WcbI family polysaccharide biosynthesis putative acetyltransferase [Pseudoalteromonas sp. YIC-656]|uniref:WcbI family polysaccharide biosynthesis putative acetyltransferase n=1 Tax=Pseudoalteromonas pernae TaxID=3118054 RepID=UPI003242FDC7
MKIVVIGNCQAMLLADVLSLKLKEGTVTKLHVQELKDQQLRANHLKLIDESNHTFSMPLEDSVYGELGRTQLSKKCNVTLFPSINFTGYHPDCIYLDKGKIKSPIGDYHSAIIALAFKLSFTVEDTCKLFTKAVFSGLGYFDFFYRELNNLEKS